MPSDRSRSFRLPFFAAFSLVAVLAVFAAPAAAREVELSLGLEPEGAWSEYSGLEVDAGLFLGVGAALDDDWSVELRWLAQDNGFLVFDSIELDTWQLAARRHFPGGGDWRPFAHGGLHYAALSVRHQVVCFQGGFGVRGPCPALRESSDDLGVFFGGGVDWEFARRWALRFDGRVAVYDSERSDELEDDVDLTAGLVFRF